MTNKSKIVFFLLAAVSAIFFGLTSLILVNLVGEHYTYLLALPILFIIGLFFLADRHLFFALVVLIRASLDAPFDAMKLGNFGLGAVLNALVIFIALLTFLDKPVRLNVNLNRMQRSWLVYLSLAFVSLLYSPVFLPSLKVFLIIVSYGSMLYMGLSSVKNEGDLGKWLTIIIYSSAIPLAYGLFSLLVGGGGARFSIQEGLRAQATFKHPNSLAFYLALAITVSFYTLKAKPLNVSPKLIKLLPFYIVALLGMLVMTKTRSAWVATYLFFFVYAFFYDRKFLIVVIAAPFLALLIPDVQDRLLDLQKGNDYGGGYERLNSFAWRTSTWRNAIHWMDETRYLTGYGIASFVHFSPKFVMANAFELFETEINAHSVYVQMFFELGILGLLSFLFLIYTNIKTIVSLYARDKLLIFTVVVLLVEFMFECFSDNMLDYLVYEWYMWFFIGVAISHVAKSKLIKS